MKILIDGAVFNQTPEQKYLDFWQQLIPRLTVRLRGADIYYLNRNLSIDFPEVTNIHNLYAPAVDYSISALEDRRLASLCRELGIDIFISTYHTSAGSGVKTLFIDIENDLELNSNDNCSIISSKQRSVRFASCYLALYQELITNVPKYANLPFENIQVIYTDFNQIIDWITVANFVAKVIINLTTYQTSQEIASIQLAEEEATQAEALQLRKQIYGEEGYKNYNQSKSYINEQNINKNLAKIAGLTLSPVWENLQFPNFNNENLAVNDNSQLPVHFFTIVLNGQPFIKYHIDILENLPFKWHWHIIEGVADLKHDTAWSLRNGGTIVNEFHDCGFSKDGTSEYLDKIAQLYPKNITLYRKPKGEFWDGKKEMVNAPLKNIQEECLLWQIDVDELWTVEQICTTRNLFIKDPSKTAAFYWCWYFVGENLIISTRNCYAENPQQDWLRTWKFIPGDFWLAHEPPILARKTEDQNIINIALINPFLHDETEKNGLVFQHYAYALESQVRFKELYYGYSDAVKQWQNLQANQNFPCLLRNYFAWVHDDTLVSPTISKGVIPLFRRNPETDDWVFISNENLRIGNQQLASTNIDYRIIIDAVFFQLYQTGIARVWRSLLQQWVNTDFANHILVLDRGNTAPKIDGIRYLIIDSYDYNNTEADQQMLQQICDEFGASLFISSYYTTPITTPSVFMAYDMIPEVMGWDLNNPMWREKHRAIQQASAYIAISQNTAIDLTQYFTDIKTEDITVAHCGVKENFSPATSEAIRDFKYKYGLTKPYFILVGAGSGYKNSILFFKAFSQIASHYGFDIVLTGSGGVLAPEYRAYTSGSIVHTLQLSDEELAVAYSGAVALVYPSKYEGFGMPIIEAMACGCPVITCPNASIPEVAGEAAIYINDDDVDGLANAICEVQKPAIRQSLITAGLAQAQKFSWSRMADIVSSALIEATLIYLNLREINLIIFLNWSQSEDEIGLELAQVIKTLAIHPESNRTTLLIDTTNVATEDAELFLSSVTMSLLMEEDLDITEGLEISLVRNLADIQWRALLPRIHGRIILENENQQALVEAKADTMTSYELASFVQVQDKEFFLLE